MRDLRSNIRTFSEPITINIYTQKAIDGVVSNDQLTTYKAYANVYLTKLMKDVGNGDATTTSNKITITLRRNNEYTITPETTEIIVRGKTYIVQDSDEFGFNTETIKVFAVIKDNG